MKKIIKSFTSKKGNQVVIREVNRSDLQPMLEYANALIAEDTFVMISGKPITIVDERKYLNETLKQIRKKRKIQLVIEVNGIFAGSCEIRIKEKRETHVGEVGISIGKDYREEGIGTVCLQTLIPEAKKLKLKLLFLHCFEINARAIHTYEKIGFIRSGIVPGMYAYKGDFVGEVTMYLKI